MIVAIKKTYKKSPTKEEQKNSDQMNGKKEEIKDEKKEEIKEEKLKESKEDIKLDKSEDEKKKGKIIVQNIIVKIRIEQGSLEKNLINKLN